MSPDEIDDILRCDREYKKGYKKQDIESFFSTTMDMQERKAFLADAMGHIYTELFIGNHRYGYCNRGNGTVEFWRGGYLSARAKTTLTLLEVAERAAQLIEQGTYRISHRGGREGGASGWNGGPENGAGRVQRS